MTVYRSKEKYRDGEAVGYSEEVHEHNRYAVVQAVGSPVVETWNGNHGSNGISIVLDRQPPASLRQCIANYRAMKDTLRPTDDEKARFAKWREWFSVALTESCDPYSIRM